MSIVEAGAKGLVATDDGIKRMLPKVDVSVALLDVVNAGFNVAGGLGSIYRGHDTSNVNIVDQSASVMCVQS